MFAALDIATGKLSADKSYQKHTNKEFVDLLGLVADDHPDVELHVVCDNYATHKHPNVKAWLAENPRVTMHFTPTSCSWLNMVEIFLGIITKQAIRRGSFHSIDDLEATIRAYIDSYNTRATPFIWTKTAEHLIGEPPGTTQHWASPPPLPVGINFDSGSHRRGDPQDQGHDSLWRPEAG